MVGDFPTIRQGLGILLLCSKQLRIARRSSSRAVCQAKWLVYRSWCRNENLHISSHSSQITVFLLWLRRVRMFYVSAVIGYSSMLSSVFRFKLPGISSSPVLQDLRFFQVNTPSRVFQPPFWDLDKVLIICNLWRMNL